MVAECAKLHFGSKAECRAAVSDAWLDEVLDSVRDAPEDVPLDQVMLQALLTVSTEAPDRWERFAEVIATRVDQDRTRAGAGAAGPLDERAADDPRIELMAIFCITVGRLCPQWWLTGAEPRGTDALALRLRLVVSLIDLRALTGTPNG